ncbi:hypothetical protein ACEOBD_17045 [Escherichia coli]|nr:MULTISPECIES: hypothetical protein [Enterobacteriaceae]MDR5229423.1 hypothetical protein [Salmonella enterica subsp. enterica serovar Kentucky]HAS0503746.1 hypothetical protein [Salmonella enterica subsp. enterica]HCR9502397.1 hypothetical protein [Salmonella enterica subsp. enterica serovar Senftenberg]ATX00061.1 hypothetical protein CU080_27325 [Escherichia coli]ATX22266.1 hypothetical protein CU076_26590 [Escherichia coli]
MAVIPMSYSPGTVARRFSILDGVTIQGVLYQVIWDSKTPFAAVIEAAPSVIDGDMRHKVVATLELQRRPQLEGVLVRKFWEDNDVAQIEGIVVDGIVRDVGLATFVYETVASKAGVVLLSDNEQYEGGKALWQHIARRSSELKVFILDTDTAQYYPFDGERVCYDGKSIPESEIWSEHPDRSKHGVVLVAESITGKAA